MRTDHAGLKALAKFVTRLMADKEYSTHAVERRSGGKVTHGTVWNIANERVKEVKASTIEGLSRALDVPESELWAIARGVSPGMAAPRQQRRELTLSMPLWERLEADAKRCSRTWPAQLEAILKTYFEVLDVNIPSIEALEGEGVEVVGRTRHLPGERPAPAAKPKARRVK